MYHTHAHVFVTARHQDLGKVSLVAAMMFVSSNGDGHAMRSLRISSRDCFMFVRSIGRLELEAHGLAFPIFCLQGPPSLLYPKRKETNVFFFGFPFLVFKAPPSMRPHQIDPFELQRNCRVQELQHVSSSAQAKRARAVSRVSKTWPWVKTNGIPFWGFRCTTHFSTYFSGDWDVHQGYRVLTHSHSYSMGQN